MSHHVPAPGTTSVLTGVMVLAIVAWVSMLAAGNFGHNYSFWSFVPAVAAIRFLQR